MGKEEKKKMEQKDELTNSGQRFPVEQVYKLTSGKEIPHYKPRGKMIYFAKEDLDEWLLQNYEPTVDEAARMANEAAATQPFFNQRRHGKRKKN